MHESKGWRGGAHCVNPAHNSIVTRCNSRATLLAFELSIAKAAKHDR